MSGSSSSSEAGFGDMFGVDEPEPEYPIETLTVDRQALAAEGTTWPGYHAAPGLLRGLYRRNDEADDFHEDRMNTQTSVAERLATLAPLQVHYRNKRHSLWGHRLWNAAKYLTKRMDQGLIDCYKEHVLELGAGLGVPGLAAFRNGAACVVITDYPDADLLDVIALNVQENAKPGQVDPDVAARLVDEALQQKRKQHKQQRNDGAEGKTEAHKEEEDEVALSEEEKAQAVAQTKCVVEPLLWGKEEHIQKVLSYTPGGCGFDKIILSDILFNHVCNDDLADTLAVLLRKNHHFTLHPKSINNHNNNNNNNSNELKKTYEQPAVAYCVFSHHRAHKQKEDYDFFDKCVARGLVYRQVDQQDYPMMFPEDRGPAEVRQPVRAYVIQHRYDNCGAPLDLYQFHPQPSSLYPQPASKPNSHKVVYDVAIQGTGEAACYLSAALSRSGFRVLHCDGATQYGGGVQRSLQLREWPSFLAELQALQQQYEPSSLASSSAASVSPPPPHEVVNRIFGTESVNTMETQRLLRSYIVDLLPSCYFSNGDVINQFIASDMARTLEFQNMARLLFFEFNNSSSPTQIVSVPLTRAEIFSTSLLHLSTKRRLMKFIKDLEASLAEQLHAATATTADDPFFRTEKEAEATKAAEAIFIKESAADPQLRLRELLTSDRKNYKLEPIAADVVTLMGELEVQPRSAAWQRRQQQQYAALPPQLPPSPSSSPTQGVLLQSVDQVRKALTSIPKFKGSTPFLTPTYGAGEVAQSSARTAAVWGATYVLGRSIAGIVLDVRHDQQMVLLSNGQQLPARVVVTPSELMPQPRHLPLEHHQKHKERRKTILPTVYGKDEQHLGIYEVDPSLLLAPSPATATQEEQAQKEAKEEEEVDEEVAYSRVVVVASRPLLSWQTLRSAKLTIEEGKDYTQTDPVLMVLMRPPTTDKHHAEGKPQEQDREDAEPVVQFVQHTTANEMAPDGGAVLHFTALAAHFSQASLEQFVLQQFFTTATDNNNNNNNNNNKSSKSVMAPLDLEQEVLYLVSFTLTARHAALSTYLLGAPASSSQPPLPSSTKGAAAPARLVVYGNDVDSDEEDALRTSDPEALLHRKNEDLMQQNKKMLRSETRHTHSFALGEWRKLNAANEHAREHLLHAAADAAPAEEAQAVATEALPLTRCGADNVNLPTLQELYAHVGLPTMGPQLFLQGDVLLTAAKQAYASIVQRLVVGPPGKERQEEDVRIILDPDQHVDRLEKEEEGEGGEPVEKQNKTFIFMERLPPLASVSQ